jgi:hypothetical protein
MMANESIELADGDGIVRLLAKRGKNPTSTTTTNNEAGKSHALNKSRSDGETQLINNKLF